MATLETGTGASTVVFAASGARHVAISPAHTEHQGIKVYCEEQGIDLSRVRFVEQPSHVALLHNWQPEPLAVVLIDGAHRFPFPILDWFYTAPHLRKGGWMLVDDAFLGSVNVLVSFLRSEPSWSLEHVFGERTVCFRKVGDAGETFDWLDSPFDKSWNFDYLPPMTRLMASARHRLFQVGLLRALVRRATARQGR